MSHSKNPFVRGYDGLSVQRLLAISYDADGYQMPPDGKLPDAQIALLLFRAMAADAMRLQKRLKRLRGRCSRGDEQTESGKR